MSAIDVSDAVMITWMRCDDPFHILLLVVVDTVEAYLVLRDHCFAEMDHRLLCRCCVWCIAQCFVYVKEFIHFGDSGCRYRFRRWGKVIFYRIVDDVGSGGMWT